MTKLEQLLSPKGLDPIRWPDDIAVLKEQIPELQFLSDYTIQNLYSNWSEDYWAAGWLILSKPTIKEFAEYLRQEV